MVTICAMSTVSSFIGFLYAKMAQQVPNHQGVIYSSYLVQLFTLFLVFWKDYFLFFIAVSIFNKIIMIIMSTTMIITWVLIASREKYFSRKLKERGNQQRTRRQINWLLGGRAFVEPSMCKQNSQKKTTVYSVITLQQWVNCLMSDDPKAAIPN